MENQASEAKDEVRCMFCRKAAPVAGAIEAGWEPYFWFVDGEGREHQSDAPACGVCAALHLEEDPQGRGDGQQIIRGHEGALAGGLPEAEAFDRELAERGVISPGPSSPTDNDQPQPVRRTWATPDEAGLSRKAVWAQIDLMLSSVFDIIRGGGLPPELAELELDDDEHSGAWCWYLERPGHPVVEVYLTPWWEGGKELVAQVMTNAEDGDAIWINLGELRYSAHAATDARAYLGKLVGLMRVVAALAPAVAR